MNTETSKIVATALTEGMTLADGATVQRINGSTVSNKRGTYRVVYVTLPGGTLQHRRLINIAGTQAVINL